MASSARSMLWEPMSWTQVIPSSSLNPTWSAQDVVRCCIAGRLWSQRRSDVAGAPGAAPDLADQPRRARGPAAPEARLSWRPTQFGVGGLGSWATTGGNCAEFGGTCCNTHGGAPHALIKHNLTAGGGVNVWEMGKLQGCKHLQTPLGDGEWWGDKVMREHDAVELKA